MKGKFTAYPNLMSVEETLKAHEDYCLLTVSTTGVNEDDCPTRVCMQLYVYDEETKSYQQGYSFDQLVKATPESIQRAIERADNGGYDVFTNGGIDRESYIAGNSVLSAEAFARAFQSFMSSLDDNTLLIGNNAEHCKKFLAKVNCADALEAKDDEGKYLCQTSLTYEFFAKNGVSLEKKTLEALRDVLADGKVQGSSEKIIGTDSRLKVMQDFVTRHGRDTGILEDERTAYFRKEDKEIRQSYSAAGKKKYTDADYDSKVQTLLETGVVKEDVADRAAECELNRLLDALEGKSGIKGVIFMQAATTGMGANDDPIQFTAMACRFENGAFIPPKKNDWISFDIQADAQSVAKAEQNMHASKPFDAFAYTGIDYETYKSGKSTDGTPLRQHDEVIPAINQFLKAFPDFIIVTSGSDAESHMSYAQKAFSQNGFGQFALSEKQKQHVDFSQVIKEYCVMALKTDTQNAVLNTEDFKGKNFNWDGIAQNRAKGAFGSTKSTMEKVQLMIVCISDVLAQNKELHPEIYAELAKLEEQEKAKEQAEKEAAKKQRPQGVPGRMPVKREPEQGEQVEDVMSLIKGNWQPTNRGKQPAIGERQPVSHRPFLARGTQPGSGMPESGRPVPGRSEPSKWQTDTGRRPLGGRGADDNERILRALEYQQNLNGQQLSIIEKQQEQSAEMVKMQAETHTAVMQMSAAVLQAQTQLLAVLQQMNMGVAMEKSQPDYSRSDVMIQAVKDMAEQVDAMVSVSTNEEAKKQLHIITSYCARTIAVLEKTTEKVITQKEAS